MFGQTVASLSKGWIPEEPDKLQLLLNSLKCELNVDLVEEKSSWKLKGSWEEVNAARNYLIKIRKGIPKNSVHGTAGILAPASAYPSEEEASVSLNKQKRVTGPNMTKTLVASQSHINGYDDIDGQLDQDHIDQNQMIVDPFLWKAAECFCDISATLQIEHNLDFNDFESKGILTISGPKANSVAAKVQKLLDYINSDMFKTDVSIDNTNIGSPYVMEVVKAMRKEFQGRVYVSNPQINGIILVGSISEEDGKRAAEKLKKLLSNERASFPNISSKFPPLNVHRIAEHQDINTLFSNTLKNGLWVDVCEGDITRVTVDAIVSSTCPSLNPDRGVAKAIRDAAGPGYIEECQQYLAKYRELERKRIMHARGGNLSCKYVIHVVGPKASQYAMPDYFSYFCRNDLCKIFANVMEYGEYLQAVSIAIPAISSGNHHIPKSVVAKAIYEASMKFDATKRKFVKRVTFINIDSEINRFIIEEFEKNIHERKPLNTAGMSNTVHSNMPCLTDNYIGYAPL